MNEHQAELIKNILDVSQSWEVREEWGPFDNVMWQLSWLSDDELYREVDHLMGRHATHGVKCTSASCNEACGAKRLVQMAAILLLETEDGRDLIPEYRYLMEFYLCMDHIGIILLEK